MSSFPLPVDVLPHRAPFLFVDEITAVDPGVSASGTWHLTGDEWFFAGHFPGRPTLPGVLMCEAIAQMGAIAVLVGGNHEGRIPLFGGLDGARLRRQVQHLRRFGDAALARNHPEVEEMFVIERGGWHGGTAQIGCRRL